MSLIYSFKSKITCPGGAIASAEYEIHRRNWNAPMLVIANVNGKRITPYEMRIHGYRMPMDAVFQARYVPDFMFSESPIFRLMRR